jgi:hypothetical protein
LRVRSGGHGREGLCAAVLQTGLAVVVAQHGAGGAEIGDGKQQQLVFSGGVAALVHQLTQHAGHIAGLERHALAAEPQLPLTRQHNEKGFVPMAITFVASSGSDPHQAGIHHLQARQRQPPHAEINRQLGVVVVVKRHRFGFRVNGSIVNGDIGIGGTGVRSSIGADTVGCATVIAGIAAGSWIGLPATRCWIPARICARSSGGIKSKT